VLHAWGANVTLSSSSTTVSPARRCQERPLPRGPHRHPHRQRRRPGHRGVPIRPRRPPTPPTDPPL